MSVLEHDLFTGYGEARHTLPKEAQKACRADSELAPGHDCCAYCAKEAELKCPGCHRVLYCNTDHLLKDAAHKGVCGLLEAIAAAERVDLSDADIEDAIDSFKLTIKAVEEAGVNGWKEAIPEGIFPVHGGGEDCQAEGAAEPEVDRRPAKRLRDADTGEGAPAEAAAATETATDAAAAAAAEATTQSTADIVQEITEDVATAAAGRNATSEEPSHDPELLAAVKVAVATSYLSYPATLVHALSGPDRLLSSCQIDTNSGALVVAVLGASEDAELKHMGMWKMLEGLLPSGVVLQMVGPEVPEGRHLQAETLSPGVRVAFFKGEYADLVGTLTATVKAPLAAYPALPAPAGPARDVTPAPPGASGDQPTVTPDSAGSGTGPVPVLPSELQALPHVMAGFNLGLTCPDYNWDKTITSVTKVFDLRCAAVKATGVGRVTVRLPWLQTSNTEVEADMEAETMRDGRWQAYSAPTRNPWRSLEPLQSGTLANDVYCKSAWVSTYQLSKRVVCNKAQGTGILGLPGRLARAFTDGVSRALLGKRRRD